jgi:hypothetical protein
MIAAAKANSVRAMDMSGRMIVFMMGSWLVGQVAPHIPIKPKRVMDFGKRMLFALAIGFFDLNFGEPACLGRRTG